jgi:hypothetical protein
MKLTDPKPASSARSTPEATTSKVFRPTLGMGVFGEERQDGSGDLLRALRAGFQQNRDDSSICRERELEFPLDPLRLPRLRCQDNHEDIPAPQLMLNRAYPLLPST